MGKPAFKNKNHSKKIIDSQKHVKPTSKTIGKSKQNQHKEKLESVIRKQNVLDSIKEKVYNTKENLIIGKKKKVIELKKSPTKPANGAKNTASPEASTSQNHNKKSKKRKQAEKEEGQKKQKLSKIAKVDSAPKMNGKKKLKKPGHQPGQFVRAPPKDDADEKPKKSKKKPNKKKEQKENGGGHNEYVDQFFEDADEETELRAGSMVRVNKIDMPLSSIYDEFEDDSDDSEYSTDDSFDSADIEDSDFSEDASDQSSPSNSDDYEYSDEEEESYGSEEDDYNWVEDSDDTDYEPPDGEDDLYIDRGQAKIYDVNDKNISFDSDSDSPQIKELLEGNESEDSCPQLVPIELETTADEENNEMLQIRSLEDEERLAADSEDSLSDCAEFFKSQTSDEVLVLLNKTIYTSGFLVVLVVVGELEVAGYRMETGDTHEIYGAKHYASVNLTPILEPNATGPVNLDAYNKHFSQSQLDELKSLYRDDTNVILLLKKMSPNNRMTILNTYMPEALFKRVSSGSLQGCEYMLQATFQPQVKCKRPLVKNLEWDVIHMEEDNCRAIIVGGKNAGKSTLAQHLVNRNIRKFGKMLLVDLDIGQPILQVAQTVSATVVEGPILGVGYLTGQYKPDKTYFYGSVDVQVSPVKYIECVRALIKHCHKTHRNMPWIINTMGMVKGYGLELLVGIIKLARPSTLIQIEHKKPEANFPHIITPTLVNEYRFLLFQPDFGNTIGSKSNFTMNILESYARGNSLIDSPMAKDLRTIQMVATLGDCLTGCEWLNDVNPISASIEGLQVLTMDNRVLQGQSALKAVNANLVYLCQKTSTEGDEDAVLECYGIGLVRAINPESGTVFLLSQANRDNLAKVNVLALGLSPLPECLLLKQSQKVEGFIPYIYNTENETVASKKIKKMQHYKTG